MYFTTELLEITGGHLITAAVWHPKHSCPSGGESWSPQPTPEGLSQGALLSPPLHSSMTPQGACSSWE